jgi:hypothetical protein
MKEFLTNLISSVYLFLISLISLLLNKLLKLDYGYTWFIVEIIAIIIYCAIKTKLQRNVK